MARHAPTLWQRFRTWFATRLGLWRGRWQRAELEANVARWTWWPWPWARHAWSYAVYQPAGLRDHEPAPLILLLHGCRQHAMPFAQASGWVRAAERGRFRLLCPEQRDGANPYRCWNWFHPPAQAGQGELDVLLQCLERTRGRVACTQVAVVGLSAGGAMAALLAFHHAALFGAVVTVAAPPLLGRANMQDPRKVMSDGLAASPTVTTLGLRQCAPLLVLQGEADEVVAPRCAEQLTEQARVVLAREHGELQARTLPDGEEHLVGDHVVLRRRLLPGLDHAWTGGPGGHAHVQREGPDLVALALDFIQSHAAADMDRPAPSV